MSNVKTYRFASSDIRCFKLAVRALSLASAKRYVKAQAIGSVVHRTLKYVGGGDVTNDWCGAQAWCPFTGKIY